MKLSLRTFSACDGELITDIKKDNAYRFDVGIVDHPGTASFSFNYIHDETRSNNGELKKVAYSVLVGSFNEFSSLKNYIESIINSIDGENYEDCLDQLRELFHLECA